MAQQAFFIKKDTRTKATKKDSYRKVCDCLFFMGNAPSDLGSV